MSSTQVIGELRGVARRVKAASLLTGVGLLFASIIAAVIAIVCIDYVTNLPAGGRVAVMFIAAMAILWLLFHRLATPLMRKIALTDLAAAIERTFPQFDDRLRSTVNFSTEAVPGSEAMKQRVVDETAAIMGRVNIRQAISLQPLYQAFTAAAIALLAAILLTLLTSPFYRQIALSRLLHPFNSPAWPKTVQIDLLDSLPQRIPVGQSLSIHMKLTHGDRPSRKAMLFYQLNGQPAQQQYMNRAADGSYVASIDTRLDTAATGNLRIWIAAGDDTVHLKPVAIVPRLAVQSITAQITPPAYAHLPPTTADFAAGPVNVGIGSHVKLSVRFNKALGLQSPSIDSTSDGAAPKATWNRVSSNTAVADWTVANSLRFHVRAQDADGFANSAAEEYEIIARPDQPPVVQIENPRRNEERTPEAIIPLQASTVDDYGISNFNLQITRFGDKKNWQMPLVKSASPESNVSWIKTEGSADEQRYRLDWLWPLATMNLAPGDTLEYHASVTDNFDLAGQHHDPVSSGTLRITIVSQDQLAEHIAEQMRQIAQQIAQAKTAQARTTLETELFSHDTANKAKLDSADRAILNRLADQQGASAAETQQLAQRLSDLVRQLQENRSPNDDLKQTATDAGNLLNQAAQGSMKQSADSISQLRDSNSSPAQRSAQLGKIAAQQQQADDQLQKALDRLGSAGSLDQTIQQVESLLKNQQEISKQTAETGNRNLGKTPAQMSGADQKQLAQNATNQKSLADKTAAAIAQMAKQAAALSKSDPNTAAALSQASDTAQQQQVTPSQQQAASSISQNEQSDAQAAQQRAEIGLQTILSGLHEAQRQQLAELSRHLADLQAQLARLVHRQAGHNLDNLNLQGSAAPKNADHKALQKLAGPDRLAASAARTTADLAAAQEQTHRNTRDIATDADKLKGAADVAGLLLQSADKMERAGVLLEQQQLQPAYDPPQTDALSLLLSAQKKVDALKADADKKLAAQGRESLRQAYVKIKADQEKLNAETVRIDKSPRLADGTLSRADSIALLKLPPGQSELADRVAQLNDRLGSLGGIVYLWANKDIHDSMADTIVDLKNLSTKSDGGTSAPLLDEQKKIVAELDAIIRSLAVEPEKSEFANRPSGGGGGKGNAKPQLPSEAELRLMKQFEQALKTQTADSDQQHAAAPKLSALGQRQQQLRGLLDQLLQKSSHGQNKLGPQPPNKNILPEEKKSASDNDQLAQQLLNEQPNSDDHSDQSISMLGDRMARVGQRLALNRDPGQTTQIIEQNILKGLDQLIQQARQQQAQSSSQQQQQQANSQQNPDMRQQPSDQQQTTSAQTHASTPARSSNVTGSAQTQTDLSQDIHQSMKEWGGLTDRQRQAVLQGANDAVIEKYKSLVDDYYRALAEKK